jgi:hypothetical protein
MTMKNQKLKPHRLDRNPNIDRKSEEAYQWAFEKLEPIAAALPGFPSQDSGVDLYVRSFLRIVRNRLLPDGSWDVEVFLDTIVDECEEMPTIARMREIYSGILWPYDRCLKEHRDPYAPWPVSEETHGQPA